MFIKAWPFLVTRNQSIDYKTVVAPDFISLANIRSLLNKASDDDLCEPGKVYIRWIKGSKVDNFTIIFRVRRARKTDIGESGNDILKDPFGREIYVTKGLVVQEHPSQILHKIQPTHLKQVDSELIEKYKKFWYEDKISDSNAINLREDTSSPSVELEKLETFLTSSNSQALDIVPNRKSSSKVSGINAKYISLLIFGLIIALMLVFLSNIIGAYQKSANRQKCQYFTTILPIKFDNQGATKALEKLTKDYPEELILLKGNLKLPDKKTSQALNKNISKKSDENSQPTITKDETQLYLRYHPIRSTIDLFKNRRIDVNNKGNKLTAIIVKNQETGKLKRFCEMNLQNKQ
ncbi:MAG: hypothetical protein MJK14_29600 [Rivularia sp. ALOHA_DT_140]|nr:hypothetical protein [Rivularia sp. ALOHA_DT_140]